MSPKFLDQLSKGIPLEPLPPPGTRNPNVPHAPVRKVPLTPNEHEIAINNALRYFPIKYHELLRAEFKEELQNYGHMLVLFFKFFLSIRISGLHQITIWAICIKISATCTGSRHNFRLKHTQLKTIQQKH